ncbi:hypothetical protein GQR60_19640, partial [Labilibaculum sp. A4]
KKIKSVNFSEGALYDITPANIEGNISGCDEKCKAIGYFEVSSVNRTQNFFSKDDFTLEFANYPKECETIELTLAPDPKKYHIITTRPGGKFTTIYVVRRNECYECNVVHPTNKPSFWP